MESDQNLAALFAAFAHPSRVAILRAFLAHGPLGLPFGQLAKTVDIAPSTLTHHLREIESAGILIRTVVGRTTMLRLDLRILAASVSHLAAVCCSAAGLQNDKGPIQP